MDTIDPNSLSEDGQALHFLGKSIPDAATETFLLYSQDFPSQDLGIVDAKATNIEICVAGHDLTIKQSPTLLTSNRSAGTTGAVVWRATPLFANWLTSPENILFRNKILHRKAAVLELGCGISGINAVVLAPHVGMYVATDQEYVLKMLRQNINENMKTLSPGLGAGSKKTRTRSRNGKRKAGATPDHANISVKALDWETDQLKDLCRLLEDCSTAADGEPRSDVDTVIACDCIYNEQLIDPFVDACVATCACKPHPDTDQLLPTVCIIAQQLRSSEIFEKWLEVMLKHFRVWRMPDDYLTKELGQGSGFAVHIATLTV